MGIFSYNLSKKAERQAGGKTVLQSIVDLDPKGLKAALKRGDSLDILSEQDDEEYLNAHIHLNFFPESDELEGAKEARAKLDRGSEILRILAENGFVMPGTVNDKFSLVKMKVVESDTEYRVYYDVIDGALWLAHSPEALKAMIAEGSNIDLKDSAGRTALHYIASYPDEYFRPDEMVRILLENGAKILDTDRSLSALLCAAYALQKNAIAARIFRLLIEYGATDSDEDIRRYADVDELSDIYEDELHRSAFVEEMIRLMHGESKLTPSELDLIVASYVGDFQTVREILKREPNININVQTQDRKYTPLMFAAYSLDIKTIRTLLKAGAAPNIQDSLGRTALGEAVISGCDIHIAELFVKYGADPDIKDINGETPYTRIFSDLGGIFPDDLNIALLFLSCGVNVDSPDQFGATPLILCTSNTDYWSNMMVTGVLIPNGANVNAQDSDGQTALMHMAQLRYMFSYAENNIIRALLNAGADTSIEDNEGNTALSIFLHNMRVKNAKEILPLLMNNGVYLGSNVESDYDKNDDYVKLMRALHYYDVEGLRKLIDEDRIDNLDQVGF